MPSIITTVFPTLPFNFALATFLLILCFFNPQQAASGHLLQQNSPSKPSPVVKLTAGELPSGLYKPMMFRSLPSFRRPSFFPPRLIPALPSSPTRPSMPTIPSFPTGPNPEGIPGAPPLVTSTPPPPSPDLRLSENSSQKNEDDKKAPVFPPLQK